MKCSKCRKEIGFLEYVFNTDHCKECNKIIISKKEKEYYKERIKLEAEEEKEKSRNEDKDDIHEKRKKAINNLIHESNKLSFSEIKNAAKLQPNSPFFQDIKSKEEFLIRNEISSLAALMAGDDVPWLETCKEIIEYADKGLKINPNSSYLLYFRGRSKGDIGLLKEGLVDLDRAIKTKSDYSDAFVERGYIRQKMGNLSGAKNDYDKGVYFDHSLQQQVNSYLVKEKTKKEMLLPSGVTFKFIVNPSLSENHKKVLRYLIIKESGLGEYFKDIDVTFWDGYHGGNRGDDELKGKQMLVKVFCPEPIVAIEKDKEDNFYKHLESKVSEWIINAIQSNTEKKYKAKLEEFLFTYQMEL